MKEEEIKEYLKRIDELELKLTGEDKDTYQWLLFGYNECARLLNEKEEVIKEAREYVKRIILSYHNSQTMIPSVKINKLDEILSKRGQYEKY